ASHRARILNTWATWSRISPRPCLRWRANPPPLRQIYHLWAKRGYWIRCRCSASKELARRMEVARRVGGVPIDRTRAQSALERAAPSESEGPALVVGVVTSDGLIAAGAWGLASLEHRVSASESTAFYVASLSKQFTALCMLLAAERGELRL